MKYVCLLSILILFLAACESPVMCEGKYLQVGDSCCLDDDQNGICDSEELAEQIKQEQDIPIPEPEEVESATPEEMEMVSEIPYTEIMSHEEFEVEEFITGDNLGANNIANGKSIFTKTTPDIYASYKYSAQIIDKKYRIEWSYFDMVAQEWNVFLEQSNIISSNKLRSFTWQSQRLWDVGLYQIVIYYDNVPVARTNFEIKS